jgi:hypothetical protein
MLQAQLEASVAAMQSAIKANIDIYARYQDQFAKMLDQTTEMTRKTTSGLQFKTQMEAIQQDIKNRLQDLSGNGQGPSNL